ncbi:MAG TPA: Lpg1974 family pore-forming outer membrane protein, partial [Caulobacteraceae bacterium]|nr:Lpg1974 family pore-forming outer membrane protein [Caulobacteraceae bacterium]
RGEAYVANNLYSVGFRPETAGTSTTSIDHFDPIDISRSEDTTVPTAGVSLGLSYAIDRVRVGAGYKWERYFDVLDGGFDTHEDADRTIDGPYFKIAVGFGG